MDTKIIEAIILTFINAFSVFLIIVVFANSFQEKMYRWFVVMTICLIGWVNFANLGYSQADLDNALIYYRLNWAFVSFFLFSVYMFYIDSFLKVNNRIFKWASLSVSLIFVYLSLFTDKVINSLVHRDWGNEIIFGYMNDYFNIFATVITIVFVYYLISRYFALPKEEKYKIIYFLIGTSFIVSFNIIFNILSPVLLGTARYQHFGDYSAVFFLAFIAYAILRRSFMNVKIALTALLIGVIGMLLIFDMFALSRTLLEQGVKFVILIFFAIISVFLVRSVLNEIRQKEQLAKINKALDESRQKYIDLASEQKDIIDVMGHEIRTPLTAIVQEIKIHKKYTLPVEKELLEEAKDLPQLSKVVPYLIETVKTVDRASTHAVALVSDMLETARLDKNRFELNYEVFDLVGIVRSNVELMQKSVDTENTSVKYDLAFIEPEFKEFSVEADKTRIGQAVYAVVNNALKYRDPEKDNVTVKVTIAKTENEAIITVVDNGIGIDKEDISKLGKKFIRLNPKTKGNLKRPGGTGLGLFVVKGIMEHHHGELMIESEGIGKGSTFRLRFPVKTPINA